VDTCTVGVELGAFLGGALFEHHCVCPVTFALEDLDLQVAHVLLYKLMSYFFLYEDGFAGFQFVLCEAELLAEAQHAARAVLVVARVITLLQPVLVLGCLYEGQHVERVFFG